MTKKEILTEMSKDAGITYLQADKAFKTILETVKKTLKKGKRVTLSEFGSFEVKRSKARKGRNPRTGEAISIPPKKRIKFNPSQSFKDSL